MKILYVGAFRLPNLDAAAPRVLTIGKMLRDAGHEVQYISWGGSQTDGLQEADGSYSVEGFEFNVSNELEVFKNPVKMFRQWYARGSKSLEMMEKISNRFDVVIAYQPGYFFLRKLKSFCRRYGKNLVVDLTEWYDNRELRLIDRPFNYVNMTHELKSVKNKILISSYLDKYYGGSHNIIIPATSDLSESKWARKSHVQFPDFDGITFIYAGTPTFKDKLYVAVNAIDRLIKEGKALRFYIFGVTRQQYENQYGGCLSENIVFMGRIPQDEVPGYYYQSDFMILLRDPTRKNMMGFPTKFTEAVSAGIPVISNDTSDIGKYLVDGENGFKIPAANEESLYKLIKQISESDKDDMLCKLKSIAQERNCNLDYRQFTEQMNLFINNLAE